MKLTIMTIKIIITMIEYSSKNGENEWGWIYFFSNQTI